MTTKKYFIPWFVLGGLLSLLLACSEKPRPVRVLKTTRPPVVKPKPDIVKKECTQEYADNLGPECGKHCIGWAFNSSEHRCYQTGGDTQPPDVIGADPESPQGGDDDADSDESEDKKDPNKDNNTQGTSGSDVAVVSEDDPGDTVGEEGDADSQENEGDSSGQGEGGSAGGEAEGEGSTSGAGGDVVGPSEKAQSKIYLPIAQRPELVWTKQTIKMTNDDDAPSLEFMYGLRAYNKVDCNKLAVEVYDKDQRQWQLSTSSEGAMVQNVPGPTNTTLASSYIEEEEKVLQAQSLGYDMGDVADAGTSCRLMPPVTLTSINEKKYKKKLVKTSKYRDDIELKKGAINYIYYIPTGQDSQVYHSGGKVQALQHYYHGGMRIRIGMQNDLLKKVEDVEDVEGANVIIGNFKTNWAGGVTLNELEWWDAVSGADVQAANAFMIDPKGIKVNGATPIKFDDVAGLAGELDFKRAFPTAALFALNKSSQTCLEKNIQKYKGTADLDGPAVGIESLNEVSESIVYVQEAAARSSAVNSVHSQFVRSKPATRPSLFQKLLAFLGIKVNAPQNRVIAQHTSEQKTQNRAVAQHTYKKNKVAQRKQSAKARTVAQAGGSSRDLCKAEHSKHKLFMALEKYKRQMRSWLPTSPSVLGFSFLPKACAFKGGAVGCSDEESAYNRKTILALHQEASKLMAKAFFNHLKKPLKWRPMSFRLQKPTRGVEGSPRVLSLQSHPSITITAYKKIKSDTESDEVPQQRSTSASAGDDVQDKRELENDTDFVVVSDKYEGRVHIQSLKELAKNYQYLHIAVE